MCENNPLQSYAINIMSANFAAIFLVKNDIPTLKKEVVPLAQCFLGIAFVHVNFFCEYCGI